MKINRDEIYRGISGMKYSLAAISSSGESNEEFLTLKEIEEYLNKNKDCKFNLIREYSSSNHTFLYFIPFLSDAQIKSVEIAEASLIIKSNSVLSVLTQNKMDLTPISGDCIVPELLEITNVYKYLPKDKNYSILPNCIICLKRLERSVSGLRTISCKDLYHLCCRKSCNILSSGCSICSVLNSCSGSQKYLCDECGGSDNLWICLICGNLGCGRYKGGHAHDHYLSTNHSFAMKLDSHHIWDYHFDKYVHWNIKSSEGTVVDVTDEVSSESVTLADSNDQSLQSSNEFISNFTTAQLESQKAFYESHISSIRRNFDESMHQLEEKHINEIENYKQKSKEFGNERQILSNLIAQYQANAKNQKSSFDSLIRELETEKKITQGLTSRIDKLQSELDKAKSYNQDLEEQVKDLLKHLEVLDLVRKAGNDPNIVEGKIMVRSAYNKKKSK